MFAEHLADVADPQVGPGRLPAHAGVRAALVQEALVKFQGAGQQFARELFRPAELARPAAPGRPRSTSDPPRSGRVRNSPRPVGNSLPACRFASSARAAAGPAPRPVAAGRRRRRRRPDQAQRRLGADRRQGGRRRMPPDPLGGPLPRRRRPRPDRLPRHETPQVVRQGAGRGVAPGRLLLETFQTDCFQIARRLGPQPRRRRRLLGADLF